MVLVRAKEFFYIANVNSFEICFFQPDEMFQGNDF